jgi:hypothetical protein
MPGSRVIGGGNLEFGWGYSINTGASPFFLLSAGVRYIRLVPFAYPGLA